MFRRWSSIDGIPRYNHQITVPEVRLIDPDGKQLGVKGINEALQTAREMGYDLVEVAPNAKPPVCKIMDFGKFKFELAKKAKEAKKKQRNLSVHEIQLRPKIDDHDLQTKLRKAREFLQAGHKLRLVMMFKGREIIHKEIGEKVLEQAIKMLEENATVESNSGLEGRRITVMLSPRSQSGKKEKKEITQKNPQPELEFTGENEEESETEERSE